MTGTGANLSAADLQQLADWNATEVSASACNVFLHTRFVAQAARTPDAVALVFNGVELTYRELDARSNQLAHLLRSRGVGCDVLVGVCAERSFEMVVALLAVMKAGGAYVPLDPGHPPELVRFMVEDAGAAIVLAQPRHAQFFSSAILLEDATWAACSSAALVEHATPQSLAYMIFTSGSTGRPKGAMNAHEAIESRLVWMDTTYGLRADDVVLQKTPFAFDVSVWEFFWPLMKGARLVLAQPEGHRDVEYLTQLIHDTGVTTLHFVPSMLALFLESNSLARCATVCRVMCSGEALPAHLAERFFARLPHVQLHNLYGPTEAAVDVTAWTCEPGATVVPIGRPIANVTIHVVDSALQLVPVGETGELCIGGIAVGRGYHGRVSLTAEKFVPNPYGAPGARMYRTGDLGRWRPDGALEYLGRIDDQVKLRGFRIELGEIESVLREHAAVADAVVTVQELDGGYERLVAYIVPREGGAELDTVALRDLTHARLPAHMRPAAFVGLDHVPVTANGKLDRRALPAPSDVRAHLAGEFVFPSPGLETELARLWEKEFGVHPIGATDDFFELGGRSLRAVRLVARIQRAFGRTLPIASFVQHPTVRKLAELLEAAHGHESRLLVPLRAGSKRPLFLVHPIGGNVFCYVDLARNLGNDQAVYGIEQQGLDGTSLPIAGIVEQARLYIEAIRAVQPDGPYLIGGWSYGGTVAYEMAQQLEAQGVDVALLAVLDARSSSASTRKKAVEALRNYDPAVLAFWFTVIMNRIAGIETPLGLADFDGLDEAGRLARIAQSLAGASDAPEVEQIRIAFTLFQNNLRALNDYEIGSYRGVMTLFRAIVPVERLPDRPTPPPWGWDALCEHIDLHDIESTHFLLLHPDHLARLAAPLREALERAQHAADSNNAHGVHS
ncbi:MAG: amino acid adenylation domain-containing protein [Polyangia bacterium]